MEYFEICDRIYRATAPAVGGRCPVIDVKTQKVYMLRGSMYNRGYFAIENSDGKTTPISMDSIKTLDITTLDLSSRVGKFSHTEFLILMDEYSDISNGKTSLKTANPSLVDPYNRERKEKPVKVVTVTHRNIKQLREELDLPDEAVKILNEYSSHVHYESDYERPIKCASMDLIIAIDAGKLDKFDKFVTSLSEYVKITHVRNIATRYIYNSYVSSSHEWKSSKNGCVYDSTFDTVYVHLNLVSSAGKALDVCFRINGLAYSQSIANDIMTYASKITPSEPRYRFAGLEKYIDQCKTRVLGDRYNPELQYTKLDGVL